MNFTQPLNQVLCETPYRSSAHFICAYYATHIHT